MGIYDTLTDDKRACQVKCFESNLFVYHIGDILPDMGIYPDNYTIVLPEYEGCKFAIVKDRKLWKLTNIVSQTIEPFIDKWGNRIAFTKKFNPSKRSNEDILKIGDLNNPFEVSKLVKKKR
jgi:hypothetical protein